MALTTPQFVAQVRQMTMTTNNGVVSDDEIAGYGSDALKVLYDIFVAQWSHWFFRSYTFSLAGGVGGNSTPIPADFQVDLGLNLNPTSATPTTVPRLSTFNERNDLQQWGNFNPVLPGVATNRRYSLDGNNLVVLPINSSLGDYELFYQAQVPEWVMPTTRSFALTPIDGPTHIGSQYGFSFNNGAFSTGDVGSTIAVAFNAPNGAWNGSFVVAAVNSPTSIFIVGTLPDPSGFTYQNPAGADVVETLPPAPGTITALPQLLNPWQLFLKAHACISVNAKRDLANPDHQRMLDQEHARAVQMSQVRASDLKQGPITRGLQSPLWGPFDDGAY